MAKNRDRKRRDNSERTQEKKQMVGQPEQDTKQNRGSKMRRNGTPNRKESQVGKRAYAGANSKSSRQGTTMEATIWYEFQDRQVYKPIVEIVVHPETMILMLRLGCGEDIV